MMKTLQSISPVKADQKAVERLLQSSKPQCNKAAAKKIEKVRFRIWRAANQMRQIDESYKEAKAQMRAYDWCVKLIEELQEMEVIDSANTEPT